MERRRFLRLASLFPLGGIRLEPPVVADGLYFYSPAMANGPGALPARGGALWIKPGGPISTSRLFVFSQDNANSRYRLMAWGADAGTSEDAALMMNGVVVAVTEGRGSDNGFPVFEFQLEPAQASAAAKALRILRQDRSPVAQSVVGTFAVGRAVFAPREPVEVVLTLRNPADASEVLRWQGGRQRGPRDNQFSFTVTRDGRSLPELEGYDFGGLSSYRPLEPGASIELRAMLGSWVDLSSEGHYSVECRYETEFNPAGARPFDDDQRGAYWDRIFTGQVAFDIRVPE
jgi:hypothetical protein